MDRRAAEARNAIGALQSVLVKASDLPVEQADEIVKARISAGP